MTAFSSKKIMPVLIIFIFINAIIFIGKSFLQLHGFDIDFLLGGHALLFLLSLISFFIQVKNMHSSSTNAFLRGIYTSLLIKVFSVMAVIATYLLLTGGKVNSPSLLALMALYIVYTTIEVKQMIKLYRHRSNA